MSRSLTNTIGIVAEFEDDLEIEDLDDYIFDCVCEYYNLEKPKDIDWSMPINELRLTPEYAEYREQSELISQKHPKWEVIMYGYCDYQYPALIYQKEKNHFFDFEMINLEEIKLADMMDEAIEELDEFRKITKLDIGNPYIGLVSSYG